MSDSNGSTKPRVVRSIDDRIRDLAERRLRLERKEKELIAKKSGSTVMGTKQEAAAFTKAFKAQKLFGFTYAQAIAALKVMSERVPEDNKEQRERLTGIGEPILALYVKTPAMAENVDPRQTSEDSGEDSGEAPSGD